MSWRNGTSNISRLCLTVHIRNELSRTHSGWINSNANAIIYVLRLTGQSKTMTKENCDLRALWHGSGAFIPISWKNVKSFAGWCNGPKPEHLKELALFGAQAC